MLERLRHVRLLRLLLMFNGMVIAILTVVYYAQDDKLWEASLYVKVGTEYVFPARGPALLLPWNLLPHDVAWLGADALVFGTLTICLTYWLASDEATKEVAGRERAAADKLKEAVRMGALVERRLQEAKAREQSAQAAERLAEDRELVAAKRDEEAQVHMMDKDVEVTKMSQALTRLKQHNKDLQKAVRELRRTLSEQQEKG